MPEAKCAMNSGVQRFGKRKSADCRFRRQPEILKERHRVAEKRGDPGRAAVYSATKRCQIHECCSSRPAPADLRWGAGTYQEYLAMQSRSPPERSRSGALDSSSENRRQKELNNCCGKVRRQG